MEQHQHQHHQGQQQHPGRQHPQQFGEHNYSTNTSGSTGSNNKNNDDNLLDPGWHQQASLSERLTMPPPEPRSMERHSTTTATTISEPIAEAPEGGNENAEGEGEKRGKRWPRPRG